MSTPAISILTRQKVSHTVHSYEHDASSDSYAQEAADKLDLAPDQVFKTLVIAVDGSNLAVAVLPASRQLSMKKAAAALKAKKACMADPLDVQRATGYVLGGVSPLGQKKSLNTLIDISATRLDSMFISAGRRGLEVELAPEQLKQLTRARFEDICS